MHSRFEYMDAYPNSLMNYILGEHAGTAEDGRANSQGLRITRAIPGEDSIHVVYVLNERTALDAIVTAGQTRRSINCEVMNNGAVRTRLEGICNAHDFYAFLQSTQE